MIELLVVMALLGLALAVGLPAFSGSAQTFKVREAARQVNDLLQRARSDALAHGRPSHVILDFEEQRVRREGSRKTYAVPETLALVPERNEVARLRLVFYPDGSATAARFALQGASKRFAFSIEPLTGRIRMTRGSSDDGAQ